MPISGEIPEAGAIRPTFRPSAFTLAEWLAALPARNRHILDVVVKDAKSELSVARRNNTLAEGERGWANTPVPLYGAALDAIDSTPRYATAVSHGVRHSEIRRIEDSRASEVNGTMALNCS